MSPPNLVFWVKFQDCPPERWKRQHFEQFWHDLREFMLRNGNARLEWIILD